MKNDTYDLTSPQKSILLTEQFHKDTCVSNICGTLEIKQKINITAIKKAINLFIKNNDSIRTHLVNDEVSTKQIILDYSFVDIEVVELSTSQNLSDLEQAIITKPFSLIERDLYRFVIFKNTDGTGGFIANLHHIISDAWTMSLLIDQIMSYYTYLLKNDSEPIPEKTYSYLDFIKSEKDYLESSKFEKSKIFWNSELDNPTFSYLKDSISNSYDAIRKSFTLSKEQTNELLKFCKDYKISLFSLWMSVLSIYLAKINNTNSAMIGTPVLNRCNFSEKNMTGMFISTVPFYSEVSKNLNCIDFLNSITKKEFAIFRHQKYPYDLILDNVRKKHNITKNLFDVCLSYQNARNHKNDCEIPYNSKWLFNHCLVNNLDIHIYDIDDTGMINLYYDFKKELFTVQEIELLHKRLLYMIKQIMENPNKTISEIEIVTPDEKNYLLNKYNSISKEDFVFCSVYEMFKKQLRQNPNKTAISDGSHIISYEQLNNISNYIAALLQKNKVEKNDSICLAFENSIEFIASIIAAQKVGACYIPIDIKYPTERIEYIIENSKSKKVLKCSNTLDNLQLKSDLVLDIDLNNICLDNAYPSIETTINPCDLAYIIYTSGSTGKPKGVKITHKSLCNYITWAMKQYVGNEVTNFPLFSSVAFDLTVTSIYTPICSGNAIYIYKNENAYLLLKQIIDDKKVQIIKLTPAHFSLLQDIDLQNSVVTKFILGGDILTKEICTKITHKFTHKIHIYNEYGPTEATVGCMIYEFNNNDDYSSVPIGKPIDYTNIYILNKEQELLPFGSLGEMYIGGNCLAQGYTEEEKTKEKFVDNPFKDGELLYKTGDLAKLYSNGVMEYFGRIDFQVKLNGYRIELGEIQSSLLTHPLIKDAFSTLLTIDGHHMLCAYYVAEKEISNLEQYLVDFLPNYMIPNHFIKVNAIPLTINGKVNKSSLPIPKKEIKEYVAPKNDLERLIQEVFSDILELDSKMSVSDNFFDYYMDSLLLIKAQSILFSRGIHINTQNFYDYKTIRELSDFLLDTNEEISYLANTNYPNIKSIVYPLENNNLNYENIILFGATGFLGIHILYNLLMHTNSKIFCIIREKDNVLPMRRLEEKLSFYFPNLDVYSYLDRIEVITGNILEENMGISDDMYQELGKKGNCVIDVAAIVKHYGNYDIFNKTNVSGTSKILDFCKQFSIPLHYVSTMSVSGFGLVDTPKSDFRETDLYIGQKYNQNVYVRSKFEAEKLILDACQKDGLIASIYRVGTITNRYSDGVFQENFNENAFLNRLSAFISLGVIPNELLDFPFEFTPVDYCANFIVHLLKHQSNNIEIYHLFNNNYVVCSDLIKILNNLGLELTSSSMEVFRNKLSNSNSNYFGITSYIANVFNYNNINLYNENTNCKLKSLNLEWPKVDVLYITKILTFLKEKKFIGGNTNET